MAAAAKPGIVCLQELKCTQEEYPAAALRMPAIAPSLLGQRFLGLKIISGGVGEFVGHEWMTVAIDVVDTGHDALLEFVF